MSARDAILNRLRHRRDGALTAPVSDFSVVTEKQWSDSEKLDLFQQKIESVHGEVHRVSKDNWLEKLKELLAEKQVKNLLTPLKAQVGVDTREALADGDVELLAYDQPIEGWKAELFSGVDAAITDVRSAIAETGTLVLWPDNDQPRLMTLVPPIHFAVVDASQLKNTFHEVIMSEDWVSVGMPTNALLISGPSKTADIEQTLAYGVHGPKELVVLVRQ
ncbi:LutC/YkgG family protein [Oceanospirillum linum]|uniref:Lactate utilization protein n=1 Tax=Oceanospirillum linum TaxID=966 RepID=A0A1T1HBR1_OCELI|nr:lactate utilization protein [Oceanospirillum linum]OOV87190.1 lactate utilization protein [Oceanospirillum linum]SEF77378.1 L-lactate dehydrogenase complex protein LldG [Oleiphilus messinensis]SMP17720.1 L-lactate dehydrogenase complex protein LldG [Oceanospirillum linum]